MKIILASKGDNTNQQIIVDSNDVVVISNQESTNQNNVNEQDNSQANLSDYDANPSSNSNNNSIYNPFDRNYSDIPIQIIGDEGSF